VALELIDSGAWLADGVIGPEALPPEPFLDLLASHGVEWTCEERVPATS
jgi:saccharopine dehydrogenase-like NADP-dependent oxidoreductase